MIFELFTKEEKFTPEIWKAFINKLLHNLGGFDVAVLDVFLDIEEISFFLHTRKDFSRLASEFVPFTLKEQKSFPEVKYNQRKKFRSKIHGQCNLLKIKEKEEYHHQRFLKKVSFSIQKVFSFSFFTTTFYFLDKNKNLSCSARRTLSFPFELLCIDFSKEFRYKKKNLPSFIKMQKTLSLFTEEKKGFLEVGGFPYYNNSIYFPVTNFEFDKHSLIVGQTGTGKSKLIELLIKDLSVHGLLDEYAVVVLDPHACLSADFAGFSNTINIDFIKIACKLFTQIGEPKIATELTILLFQTLMKDQFNPKMERVLKYTLFVLFSSNTMSLNALKKFLTDIIFRKEVLTMPGINEPVAKFFDTDFSELETRFYEQSIMPILVLLDELTFLPINNFEESESLKNLITNNSLVFLSLNKSLLGDKAIKLLAGLLIQQLFLLVQSHAFHKKIIFIIDEVAVVQNDALPAILSEARKFNLSLYLTQQYLGQVDKTLLQSIITNTYNYFIFKISEDDAKLLVNNLEFEFTGTQLKSAKEERGLSEENLKSRMITTLNPRECLIRIYKDEKFYPVFKARTIDI